MIDTLNRFGYVLIVQDGATFIKPIVPVVKGRELSPSKSMAGELTPPASMHPRPAGRAVDRP